MTRLEELTAQIARTEHFVEHLKERLKKLRIEAREEIKKESVKIDGGLTVRQREVLILVHDFSNKEIADRLGVSLRTAKFHVSKVLQRFKVESRTQLP